MKTELKCHDCILQKCKLHTENVKFKTHSQCHAPRNHSSLAQLAGAFAAVVGMAHGIQFRRRTRIQEFSSGQRQLVSAVLNLRHLLIALLATAVGKASGCDRKLLACEKGSN